MREFYFVNDLGQRKNLNTRPHIFAYPTGLGYQRQPDYSELENGFYIKSYDKREVQAPIYGELYFTEQGKQYQHYKELVNWLNNGRDIRFVYSPDGTKEYCRDVDIVTIEKTELSDSGWLKCPIQMMPKTPWYSISESLIYVYPVVTGNVKRYPYRYAYRYQQTAISNSVEIETIGHFDAGFELTIDGEISQPTILLTDFDTGEEYGRMILDCLIDSGDTLKYSSAINSSGIWINGEDAIEHIDINNNNFFQIPVGRKCILKLTALTTINTIAYIKKLDYYRSV